MTQQDKVELHAIVHGHVQGVFFRDTTRRFAREMGITGTVKNLPNGSVEIYAQGSKEQLERLLATLSGRNGPGQVSSMDISYTPPAQIYPDFIII